MSFYDCTLNSILQIKKSPFKTHEICHMGLEIATGLAFLHSHNIIHRDIKSENIFVEVGPNNELLTLVIGDFDTALDTRYNTPKNCIGTPHFMAPEVHSSQNEKSYGLSADIYSFGLLLYELITLKLPFADVKVLDLYKVITSGTKPSLPENFDSGLLYSIFDRCTSLDPTKRPTALGLIEDLMIGMSPTHSPSSSFAEPDTIMNYVTVVELDISRQLAQFAPNVAVRPLNNSAEAHEFGIFLESDHLGSFSEEPDSEIDESDPPDSARDNYEPDEGSPLFSPKTPEFSLSPSPPTHLNGIDGEIGANQNGEERSSRWISKSPSGSGLKNIAKKSQGIRLMNPSILPIRSLNATTDGIIDLNEEEPIISKSPQEKLTFLPVPGTFSRKTNTNGLVVPVKPLKPHKTSESISCLSLSSSKLIASLPCPTSTTGLTGSLESCPNTPKEDSEKIRPISVSLSQSQSLPPSSFRGTLRRPVSTAPEKPQARPKMQGNSSF